MMGFWTVPCPMHVSLQSRVDEGIIPSCQTAKFPKISQLGGVGGMANKWVRLRTRFAIHLKTPQRWQLSKECKLLLGCIAAVFFTALFPQCKISVACMTDVQPVMALVQCPPSISRHQRIVSSFPGSVVGNPQSPAAEKAAMGISCKPHFNIAFLPPLWLKLSYMRVYEGASLCEASNMQEPGGYGVVVSSPSWLSHSLSMPSK
jgi:hypothetical protein